MYGKIENKDGCPGKQLAIGNGELRFFYSVPNQTDPKRPPMIICRECFHTYVEQTLEVDAHIPSFRGSTEKYACSSDNAMYFEKDMTISITDARTGRGYPLARQGSQGQNRIAVYMPSGTEYKINIRHLGGPPLPSNGQHNQNLLSSEHGFFRVPVVQFANGEEAVRPDSPVGQTSYPTVCEIATLVDGKTPLMRITPNLRPAASATDKENGLSDSQPEKHIPTWMMDSYFKLQWIRYAVKPPPARYPPSSNTPQYTTFQPSAPTMLPGAPQHLQVPMPSHPSSFHNNTKKHVELTPCELIVEFHSPVQESEQHRKDANMAFVTKFLQAQMMTLQPERAATERRLEAYKVEIASLSKQLADQDERLGKLNLVLQNLSTA